MRFRKKSALIEAEQWWPWKEVDGVILSPVLEPTDYNPSGEYGQIMMLEGITTCLPGDWIITDVNGERHPCKPDIFEKTYEVVTE